MREWLAIIVIIAIVLILLDGFRRKFRARQAIRVKLDKNVPGGDPDEEATPELPSGGARIRPRQQPLSSRQREQKQTRPPMLEERQEPVWGGAEDDDALLAEELEYDDVQDETENEPQGPLPGQDEPRETRLNPFPLDDVDAEDDIIRDEQGRSPLRAETAPRYDWPDTNDEEQHSADEHLDLTPPAAEAERPRSTRRERPRKERPVTPAAQPADSAQNELPLQEDDDEWQGDEAEQAVQEVIVINVMAPAGEMMSGRDMLAILLKQGMRLGHMSIFHRHADSSGKGPVMFSLANMVKPGTFDMATMDDFTTPGVSLFMQMPSRLPHMKSFDHMLETAQALRDQLGGELKDEHRSVLTRQTIEHYRQRIRDFELTQLARRQS